jgi:hypothetical protein
MATAPRFILEIDVGERLSVVVTHDDAAEPAASRGEIRECLDLVGKATQERFIVVIAAHKAEVTACDCPTLSSSAPALFLTHDASNWSTWPRTTGSPRLIQDASMLKLVG